MTKNPEINRAAVKRYREKHLDAIREKHRLYRRHRRTMAVGGGVTGVKPVAIMYPESTIPDWFTLAEYKRRQSEFASDAVVFINGQRVETQMELI